MDIYVVTFRQWGELVVYTFSTEEKAKHYMKIKSLRDGYDSADLTHTILDV